MAESGWNYQIIHREDGTYSVHEVFYTSGEIDLYGDPERVIGDDPKDVLLILRQMFDDCLHYPVLEESEIKGRMKEFMDRALSDTKRATLIHSAYDLSEDKDDNANDG